METTFSERLQKFLDQYMSHRDNPIVDDGETILYRGRVRQFEDLKVPDSFVERAEWKDGWFRTVWISYEERAILTYCEDDINITIHLTEGSFQRELGRAARYYKTDETSFPFSND
jgi:predicted dehydrogenase